MGVHILANHLLLPYGLVRPIASSDRHCGKLLCLHTCQCGKTYHLLAGPLWYIKLATNPENRFVGFVGDSVFGYSRYVWPLVSYEAGSLGSE